MGERNRRGGGGRWTTGEGIKRASARMKIIRGVYCSVLNNGRGSGRTMRRPNPRRLSGIFACWGKGGGEEVETARAGNNQREKERRRRRLESKGKKGVEGGGRKGGGGGGLPSRLFKFERLPWPLNEPTFMHYALARTKNPRGDTETPGVERGRRKGERMAGNRGAQGERNSESAQSLLRT